jgi:4a-hydroxytetrahydrobiopterin dehydratase
MVNRHPPRYPSLTSTMPIAMPDADIQAALATVPGWTHQTQPPCLAREWLFADFVQAFGFVTQVALLAQAMDHHPDWSQSYNRVSMRLHSHDAGGVTLRDLELARRINAL